MLYDKTKMNHLEKMGRNVLKADWNCLDNAQTARGLKLPLPEIEKSYPEDGVFVKLRLDDVSNLSQKNLYQCTTSRRSVRQYSDEAIGIDELSYMLYQTGKLFKTGKGYSLRAIPTGGAKHSLETYVYIRNVIGIQRGLYRFIPSLGDLLLIDDSAHLDHEIGVAMKNQMFNSAVVFFWSAIPKRAEYKYSYTAHKMIAIEAGHACQNLYLGAEALELGCCAIAAYDQTALDQVLGFNPEEEFVVYAAVVGKKAKKD
ncbi:MAG: SagB/ThcOx family dehydrogenase [Bacilli bacterium]|nr:SagB/ThcOx family dehydrogenase [Bacilli bacterium]